MIIAQIIRFVALLNVLDMLSMSDDEEADFDLALYLDDVVYCFDDKWRDATRLPFG